MTPLLEETLSGTQWARLATSLALWMAAAPRARLLAGRCAATCAERRPEGAWLGSWSVTDAEAYSRVPYPGLAFPQTHPDRLALLATLHGLDPAPPDAARVLEVGCADGLNLVAMAGHAPGLHAAGFDLVDPALGRQAAAELGLANVELEQGDLLDARDRGEFDYVVAHGVYGWVPAPARDALMALIARALAPHGVAFVSYNALPGRAHAHDAARDGAAPRRRGRRRRRARSPAGASSTASSPRGPRTARTPTARCSPPSWAG